MEHAILDLLKTKTYPQFTEVIRKHFKLKKDHILKVCQKWIDDINEYSIKYPSTATAYYGYVSIKKTSDDYIKIFDEIKKELDKIV